MSKAIVIRISVVCLALGALGCGPGEPQAKGTPAPKLVPNAVPPDNDPSKEILPNENGK